MAKSSGGGGRSGGGESTESKLLAMGGKKWEKNGMSRIYFNGHDMIRISGKSEGQLKSKSVNNILSGKYYYDLKANQFVWSAIGSPTVDRAAEIIHARIKK